MAFKVDEARKEGYDDKEILKFLHGRHPSFDVEGAKKEGYDDKEIIDFLSSYKNPLPQEPATVKGTLGAYGAGFGGGTGGVAGDVQGLVNTVHPLPFGLTSLQSSLPQTQFKNTPEQTESLSEQFGIPQPQNALERIAQQSGEFAGQGGVLGTALGGPAGGLLGAGIGTAGGALYGSLKELGLDENLALLISALIPGAPGAISKGASKINKIGKKSLPPGSPPPGFPPTGPAPLISPGKELGMSPSTYESRLNLINKIEAVPEEKSLGEVISKEPFRSEAQGARDLSKAIKEEFSTEKEAVREAYNKAKEVSRTHSDIFPELAASNEEAIARLQDIEKRSTAQESVLKDRLALRNLIGDSNGLIEQNAARLMEQADSFSSNVKYDQAYAGAKGEIKGLVGDINKSVIESLKKSGKNAEPVLAADRKYGAFADRFYSDEIAPFLQKRNLNPEALYKKTIEDTGTYRAAKGGIGSRKHPIIDKLDRELVNQRMDKYFKSPQLIISEEYSKDLNNLNEIIGKEKTADVDAALRSKLEKASQKSKMLPEDIDKIFRNRSSIRKFRRELEQKGLKKEFDKLAEDEILKLFKEGHVGSKTPTGNELVSVMDKNHEVLEELMGKESFDPLYKESKAAGKKEIAEERGKHLLKQITKISAKSVASGVASKVIPVLIGVVI